MTQTVEFDLAKVLEDLRQDTKETNHKLDKVIESQARIEGEVKALQVEVQNVKKDVEEVKSEIKGRISIQSYWFLSLLSVLVSKIVFFSNP